MFYSQIILAKKGPLGKVWMAAHWGDKKLGRPQIFATDISASVDSIVHPQVPLALRVSGHLLLGVVRIYSRKVKYLMHDCHEAMVKIKMAFRPSQEKNAAIDLPSNLKESSNMNVANFGEYHEVVFEITDAPTGFQLPFEINDDAAAEDWVPADLDETHEIVTGLQAELGEYGSPRDAAAAAVNNTLNDSELTDMLNRGQDEAWTAWNVDEEGEEVPFQDDSHVSDIEITRAANDSISSEAQIGRASILDKPVNSSLDSSKINLTAGGLTDQNEFPIADDTEMIPFDDEDDTRHDIRNASLNLSVSRDGSAGNATVAIGGLDDSQDSAVKGSVGNKRASVAPKRRTRKRRKVVVDNDDTELPNKHIKDMLADTSDIVLQNVVHPATWVPGQDKASHKRSARDLLFVHLSYEKILARPALGDDGQLAPELLALWAKNTAPVVGKPFPYELRVGANEEDESDEDESIEEPRRRQSHEADPDRLLETRQVQLQDMHESGSIVNDDEPTPWDDQDELPGPMDDSRDEEHLMNMSGDGSDQPLIFLGHTNAALDVEIEDEEDTPRQGGGDSLVSSNSKWHKHTISVFNMLKKNIASENVDDQNSVGEPKTTELSYTKLSRGVDRRTAAGVFLELLQLKTWDYIELNQNESYGDIRISAGIKFSENPPSN